MGRQKLETSPGITVQVSETTISDIDTARGNMVRLGADLTYDVPIVNTLALP